MLPTKAPTQLAGMRILDIGDVPENKADRKTLLGQWADRLEITVASPALALELLRKQMFDVALVWHSHQLDSVTYLPTLRTVAPESLGVVVLETDLGTLSSDALQSACLAAGSDGYLGLRESSDVLCWRIHRAVERRQLLCHAQLWSTHQSKTRQEDHHEAIHQVRSLRAILLDNDATSQPPEWLVDKFAELLRAYVVAVSGDLADEVGQLVSGLKQSGVTQCEALMAHSVATEQLVISIGPRPGWHMLGRSQMLAYEVMLQYSRDLQVTAEMKLAAA